jgi:hypothetical protein
MFLSIRASRQTRTGRGLIEILVSVFLARHGQNIDHVRLRSTRTFGNIIVLHPVQGGMLFFFHGSFQDCSLSWALVFIAAPEFLQLKCSCCVSLEIESLYCPTCQQTYMTQAEARLNKNRYLLVLCVGEKS